MDVRGLPFRTFTILVIGLLVLYLVATSTAHASVTLFSFAVIGAAILLSSIVLIPAVRQAVKARLDTPAGRVISAAATVLCLLAATTCAVLWWQYLPWNVELQRPVTTPNQMALLAGAGLTLALTAPIAWRWLAARLLSRPASSLAFFRSRPGQMRLLIVLSIVFVLLAPRLQMAIQPWSGVAPLNWLPEVFVLVTFALWSVLILATLSGVAQLLLRCFGRRGNHPVVQ